MITETNRLLSASRFPRKFYDAVTGDSNVFNNPGDALSSWIVFNVLGQEYVDLAPFPEIQDLLIECEVFSSDLEVAFRVVAFLSAKKARVDSARESLYSIGYKTTPFVEEKFNLVDAKFQEIRACDPTAIYHPAVYLDGSEEIKRFKQLCYEASDALDAALGCVSGIQLPPSTA